MVKDVVDPVSDGKLAEFVVSSHIRSHPSAQVSAQVLSLLFQTHANWKHLYACHGSGPIRSISA